MIENDVSPLRRLAVFPYTVRETLFQYEFGRQISEYEFFSGYSLEQYIHCTIAIALFGTYESSWCDSSSLTMTLLLQLNVYRKL